MQTYLQRQDLVVFVLGVERCYPTSMQRCWGTTMVYPCSSASLITRLPQEEVLVEIESSGEISISIRLELV